MTATEWRLVCPFCSGLGDEHLDGCAGLEAQRRAVAATLIRFPQPVHQLTMNQRQHWADKGRTVKAWREVAAWNGVEHRGHGPALVYVSLEVRGHARRDPHNWFATVKPIIDGLVDAKVWPDDTPRWVETREPLLIPVRRERWQPLWCAVALIPRPQENRASAS